MAFLAFALSSLPAHAHDESTTGGVPEVQGLAQGSELVVAELARETPTRSGQRASIREKTGLYDVVLVSSGPNKALIVKRISDLTGVGLKEARDLVDSPPSLIKEGVDKKSAEDLKMQLESVGATVEIE